MNELNENELGDLLVRLHDSIDESTVMTPTAASQQIRRRARHLARRRGTMSALLACSAVMSIAAVGVIVAISVNDDDRGLTRLVPLDPTDASSATEPTPTGDPVSSTDPTVDASPAPVGSDVPATSNPGDLPSSPLRPADNDWQVLPAAPLAERSGVAAVTVGDQLVVWGGGVPNHLDGSEPPYNDGAVLDVATGAWRAMAASPLTGGSATGVALDQRVIFVDATGASASYEPATDTWAPIQGAAPGLVQIVDWRGQLFGNTGTAFSQLGPDGWSSLTPFDSDVQNVRLAVIGDELLTFGERTGTALEVGRWDSGLFTALATSPSIDITGGMFGVGAVDGRAVVVSWTMQALAYDPASDEWSPLPDLPGFRVKCQPQVGGIGPTAVVRMCGFVAVLADGSPSWAISSPFAGRIDVGLHIAGPDIDRQRIIVGGSTTVGDPAGQLLTPIIMGFVTIEPAAAPTGFSANPSSDQISTHLSAGDCALTVDADSIPQQTMADAVAAAQAAPDSVTWGNTAGSATLQCSSGDAYLQAFSTLRTGGERTVAVDATDEIVALGTAPAPTMDDLIQAIWPALQQRHTDGEFVPQVALTWDVSDPIVTFEVFGFADDSVSGVAYTIGGRSTPQGWVVGSATVASICGRGVAVGTDGQLCI